MELKTFGQVGTRTNGHFDQFLGSVQHYQTSCMAFHAVDDND